jgi:hypothetical protein
MSKLRFKISMSLDSVGDLHGLDLVRTVAAPKAPRLKFAKR